MENRLPFDGSICWKVSYPITISNFLIRVNSGSFFSDGRIIYVLMDRERENFGCENVNRKMIGKRKGKLMRENMNDGDEVAATSDP
jgi:hypothetical protein